jgi:peptidoglycan/LPS O-acetylase OafA/YrhL
MMKKLVSMVAGILQAFVAFGALVCGVLLMFFPKGTMMNMPLSMLKGSPFADFFLPGLILFAVIGLGQAVAAVMSFRRRRHSGEAGAVMGIGLMIWIFVQVSMIGGGHWLQYLYFAFGVAEVSMAILLLTKGGLGTD